MKTLMISIVLVLAILSGTAAMAYANGGTDDTTTAPNGTFNCGSPLLGGGNGFSGRRGHGWGPMVSVTVSQEYKDNVVNIAEGDSDVQALLEDGYNITDVRPIISATVEADGNVSMKATSAVVTLSQSTTGRAIVWVDVEQGKVTRIEILTITVIEKT